METAQLPCAVFLPLAHVSWVGSVKWHVDEH